MDTKLSIIIPAYNLVKSDINYLQRCVDSFMDEIDLLHEVIIVDDGSTDGTAEWCDNIAKQSSRFRVIHKKNGGVSSARNTGIFESTGDYIWFIDGDDYLTPKAISTVLTNISKGVDVVFIGYKYVYENNATPEQAVLPICKSEYLDTNEQIVKEIVDRCFGRSLQKIYGWYQGKALLDDKEAGAIWRLIIKRDVLTRNDIKFNPSLTIAEDQMYFCDSMASCNNCVIIHEALYCYYQRKNSAMHTLLNNHEAMVQNKIAEIDERTRITNKHPQVRSSWQGTAVLTAILVCTMAVNCKHGYKLFKSICKKTEVRNSYKQLSIKSAPLKLFVVFGFMKLKLYLPVFCICKLCKLLNINITPTT